MKYICPNCSSVTLSLDVEENVRCYKCNMVFNAEIEPTIETSQK